MLTIIASFIYLSTWIYQVRQLAKRVSVNPQYIILGVGLGVIPHAVSVYATIFTPEGLMLGFFRVASLIFLVINLLVGFSCLRKPLHNLFAFILPLTAISLIVSLVFESPVTQSNTLDNGMMAHILLSLIAYSLLTIASLQALLLAYQNKQLKARHFHNVIGILPPVETMEKLLFELVWAGFIFLSLSVGSGTLYIENILEQHLSHKMVFSVLSWVIYAVLLLGRHFLGWRGKLAVQCIIGGFIALMLSYFGSKLVIEIILDIQ
ncbi:MAG: phosphohydrolase [Alteromonadaceae bacterium]|nr:MAG: phosphohydrolase [Alteromonadaceae bacterium]